MRLVVTGGRNYANRDRAYFVLDRHHAVKRFTVLISGHASGLDSIAEDWANARGVRVEPYPAHWDDLVAPPVVIRVRRDGTKYNAAAGGIRNQRMIDEGKPEFAMVFDGGSGTADMVERIAKAGIPGVRIVG